MFTNKISAAMAVLLVSTAPVIAADAIVEPMPTPPMVEEAVSWTGGWVSGGIGYGTSNTDMISGWGYDTELYGDPCEGFCELVGEGFAEFAADGISGDGASFRLGGGFDFQASDQFVAGVFGDYNWADNSAEAGYFGEQILDLTNYGGGESASGMGTAVKVDTGDSWVLGGRLGFLVNPDTLFYGLVGYTEVDQTVAMEIGGFYEDFNIDAGGGGQTIGKKNFTSTGIVMGAGMEARITENISLKAEYRYTSLDKQKASWEIDEELDIDEDPFEADAVGGAGVELETDNHDVTVSLAYRF